METHINKKLVGCMLAMGYGLSLAQVSSVVSESETVQKVQQTLEQVKIEATEYVNHKINPDSDNSSYRYSIIGELPAGLSLTPDGYITGSIGQEGQYDILVQMTDEQGQSTEEKIAMLVEQREDPSNNADVWGIQDAQWQALKRFALIGEQSAFSRLDRSRMCMRSGAQITVNSEGKGVDFGKISPLRQSDCSNFSVWFDTSFTYGKDSSSRSKFTSPGYTLGTDYRINSRAIIGAAATFSGDDATFESKAHNTGNNVSVVAYNGFKINDKMFLDTVLGYSKAKFNSVRYLKDGNTAMQGKRKAKQKFASMRFSGKQTILDFTFVPYAKYELGRSTLSAYTETSEDMPILRYEQGTYSYANASVGLKISKPFSYEAAKYEPYIKLESRNSKTYAHDQMITYADMPHRRYHLTSASSSSINNTFSIGLDYMAALGISSSISWTTASGGENIQKTFNINLRVPF